MATTTKPNLWQNLSFRVTHRGGKIRRVLETLARSHRRNRPWRTSLRRCARTGTWMRCFLIGECTGAASWQTLGRTRDNGQRFLGFRPREMAGGRLRALGATHDALGGAHLTRLSACSSGAATGWLRQQPHSHVASTASLQESKGSARTLLRRTLDRSRRGSFRGDRKGPVLRVARRFADYIAARFGREPGQLRGYWGHPEIELALLRLYFITKERRYLDLCR